ncbi:Anion exchange protein 3, partial [Homalodisca vitripennis]
GDRDGGTPEPDLDEEMEKVFATSESERFNLASISSAPESLPNTDQRRYDEQDYSSHRKKNYPHIHMPLKIMHPRSMRKRTSSHRESHEGTEGAEVPREPQEDQEPEPPTVVEEEPTTRTARGKGAGKAGREQIFINIHYEQLVDLLAHTDWSFVYNQKSTC